MLKILKVLFLNYNFIFSLIGCFTGLFATVLSLFLYFKENLKLKINNSAPCYLGPLQFSTISDEYGIQNNTYTLDNCVFSIALTISNNSKNATTINEIALNNKYILNSYSGSVDSIPEVLVEKDGYLVSNGNSHIIKDYLLPPIELQPFSTVQCYLNFWDVPYTLNFNKKIKLTFKCIQKNCSKKLKVNPIIIKIEK